MTELREGRRTRGTRSSGRATIVDVARRAGVSHSTVSRVLSGTSRTHPETLRAIESAVAELNYRANPLAQAMRTKTSGAIGLVIDNVVDPVYPEVIGAITSAAEAGGYSVVLATAGQGPASVAPALRDLVARGVDGMVIVCSWQPATIVPLLARVPLPVVLTGTEGEGAGAPQFGTDNVAGARLAAEHLLRLGHERIAYVGGPPGAPFSAARLSGYRQAWEANGLPGSLVLEVPGDGTETAGLRAGQLVHREHRDVTAIAGYNDRTALGVIAALAGLGVPVPTDMSVIGFDDIPQAAWAAPGLTTVAQQAAAMGSLAVERLMALVRSPRAATGAVSGAATGADGAVRLAASLVVRESTATPR